VPSPLRARVERWSVPMLARLRLAPRWLIFALTLGLVVGGLFAGPPLGPLLLLVLAALMAWLTYLSWPALTGNGRLSRVLVLLLLVGVAAQGAVSG
jgi:hypothetical protein